MLHVYAHMTASNNGLWTGQQRESVRRVFTGRARTSSPLGTALALWNV